MATDIKKHIRNTSIFAALIMGGIAVTTAFCGKNNQSSQESNLPAGIGSWTLNATADKITMTVNSCIKGHVIYCEYDITKYTQSGSNEISVGSYKTIYGKDCKQNYVQVNDANPCDLNQGDMELPNGKATFYKFNRAKCYDTTQSDNELVPTAQTPSRVDCNQ